MSSNLKDRIRRQRRQELAPPLLRAVYKDIMISGFQVSLDYRMKLQQEPGLAGTPACSPDTASLTYGEVVVESFLQILHFIERAMEPSDSTTADAHAPLFAQFVDLGCGTGRACLTAALSTGSLFKRIIGIELVPELVSLGRAAKHRLETAISTVSETVASGSNSTQSTKAPSKVGKKASLHNAPAAAVDHPMCTIERLTNEMLRFTQELLEQLAVGQTMPADTLANALCKAMGHKQFKVAVKPFKTFQRFLLAHPTLFSISSAPCEVSLLYHVDLGIAVVSSSANSPDIDIPTCVAAEPLLSAAEDNAMAQQSTPMASPIAYLDKISSIIKSQKDVEALLPLPPIDIDAGDIFEVDWWTTDGPAVAYAASLLFTDEMMLRLSECVQRMHPKSWFISLKPLPEGEAHCLRLVDESFYKMSWQMAKVRTSCGS